MSERTEHAHGTPSWSDFAAPDVDGATAFYGGLFGWDSEAVGSEEETGGYRQFLLRGKRIAGYGPPGQGEPPSWRTYVSVDDADAIVAAVEENGGKTMVAPMDVMDAGRMAVFSDPEGAVICVWQPKEHTGAELVNEPGAMCWNEVQTRDVDASKAFYTAVFPWTADTLPGVDGPDYTQLKIGDGLVAGMFEMTEDMPAEIPPFWLTYFACDDADATAAKAKELGGDVVREPFDVPEIGRIAILADPARAGFGVVKLDNPS